MEKRARAFSLVELLVVIVILLILAGLLSGLGSYAFQTYYDVRCKANLKNLSTMIRASGDGSLPTAYRWVGRVVQTEVRESLICPLDTAEVVDDSVGVLGFEPSGNVVQIDPPPSCCFDTIESNTQINAFIEQESYTLPSDVTVDISEPGYYGNNYNSTARTIPAGTPVDSTFLFFDPVGSQSATSDGVIRMSGEILGIIVLNATLDASDPILGRPGTQYDTGHHSRGFEGGAEQVTLEDDLQTFTINRFKSTYPGENVRILTVPGGGGITSYGMNAEVQSSGSPPRMIGLLEYNRSVADPSATGELEFHSLVAPRHFGRVNVLFLDGSVLGLTPEQLDPETHRDLWHP